jgi:hypothetical protein
MSHLTFSAVMAAGIGLRETRHCSKEAFEVPWGKALVECLGDAGGPQGCGVCNFLTRYKPDEEGRS